MPDPRDFTAQGMIDKVLGYGDRAVKKGTTATTPPAGMTSVAPAAAPAPQPLTITFYDPQRALQGKVAAAVEQRIERDLNALHLAQLKSGDLVNVLHVRFEIQYRDRMSTKDERAGTGVFDFPVYLLHARGTLQTSPATIRQLMLEHGIRDGGEAHEQFEQADTGWLGSAEGLGIQPLSGFKKVGFIKADELLKASNLEIAFSNVIKHELGHMLNLRGHSTGGAMRVPATFTEHLDYASEAAKIMWTTLARLTSTPKAELERRYAQDNP